jgi:hypothetical protein
MVTGSILSGLLLKLCGILPLPSEDSEGKREKKRVTDRETDIAERKRGQETEDGDRERKERYVTERQKM